MYRDINTINLGEVYSDDLKSVATKLQKNTAPTILQRIAELEATAIGECLEHYGNFIWNLAKMHTQTAAATEIAVEEIFSDIWKHAEGFDAERCDEKLFVALIALRRLLKTKNEQ